MSEPTDINDNDPTDDQNLSSLYTRTSDEQPSKALDAAILAKAKRELKGAAAPSRYYPAWTQSLSVAAVMVLSVSVLFMIEKESPEELQGSAPVVVIEQEQTTGKFEDKLFAKSTDLSKEKRQTKGGVTTELASAPEPASESAVIMNREMPIKAKARKKIEAPARESDTDNVASFAPSAQTPQAMGIVADRLGENAKEGIGCQQISEKECLESAACTLSLNKELKTYQCLPAKDHCELMFRQGDGTKESCGAKDGCEFLPAQCYCPPEALCVCAGGNPPQCKTIVPE